MLEEFKCADTFCIITYIDRETNTYNEKNQQSLF